MKTVSLSIAAALALALTACGGADQAAATHEENNNAAMSSAPAAKSKEYTVDAASSQIAWTGNVTGAMTYNHTGVVAIKSGSISVIGSKITAGQFVVDMTTIAATDSASYNEEHPITDLEGHLKTGDFFNVEAFPEAKFVITSAQADKITGDLTVRGKTSQEVIEVSALEVTEAGVTAAGKLTFDRQKYDVAWAHFVKDALLADDIVLDITLSAR